MIDAAAYVLGGRFCVMGVCPSRFGPIPFKHSVPVENMPDGPVDLEGDTFGAEVAEALDDSERAIMKTISVETIKQGAKELVERARQGDQVAMATLQMVREGAQTGAPAARRGLAALKQYIKAHPLKNNPGRFGLDPAESNNSIERVATSLKDTIKGSSILHYRSAVVSLVPTIGNQSAECAGAILANGPSLFGAKDSNPRITAVRDAFKDDKQKKAFVRGFKTANRVGSALATATAMSSDESKALQIGFTVGWARAIQAVRLPNTPISVLSADAAWELGE